MIAELTWLVPLLKARLGKAAEATVRARMAKAEPGIINGMLRKNYTPEVYGTRACVRDAIFRLWERVLDSGTVADWIRDGSADTIIPRVLETLPEGATLAQVVTATREAVLEQVF